MWPAVSFYNIKLILKYVFLRKGLLQNCLITITITKTSLCLMLQQLKNTLNKDLFHVVRF